MDLPNYFLGSIPTYSLITLLSSLLHSQASPLLSFVHSEASSPWLAFIMVGVRNTGLFLALAAQCLGSVLPATNRLLETLEGPPRDWVFHSDALPRMCRHHWVAGVSLTTLDESVKLDVSLREQNLPQFEQLVIDVNDPSHEKYGQHLKGHEVADMLRPSEHAISSVAGWLEVSSSDLVQWR
jgi:Pro-kumamolisin, activation domain